MTALRTYVLDTSVLLSDPGALSRFGEHRVVLPITVVEELEGKRHHPELGWFARESLRTLDELRQKHGRLDTEVPVNAEGGTLRIEMEVGHGGDNDAKILGCARALRSAAKSSNLVVLVSKDVPLRVKAGAVGLRADEYRAQEVVSSGWTGMAEVAVDAADIDTLYRGGVLDLGATRDLPVNTGLTLKSGRSSALGRVTADKTVKLVRGDQEVFGVRGRSAEQRIALDLLTDPDVGIVSLGGRAGTGKSAMALTAGLEAVLERRTQRKIVVFRPLYAVGGQDLGYLPGTEDEKMGPWAQAVFDTLDGIASQEVIDEVVDRKMLEILPLTHIRGRSLHDSFVIVDEAQSLERNVLLTVLSRLGRGSRITACWDSAQRDNHYVGRHDGIASVVERLKGHPLFAHITFTRSERSAIAELVTDLLEDFTPGSAA